MALTECWQQKPAQILLGAVVGPIDVQASASAERGRKRGAAAARGAAG